MKRRSRSNLPAAGTRAITLIEILIYMSVLLVVMAVGYAAFYRCLDYSTALRRSTDDIARTLQAGERWRADVRAAGRVQLTTNATEEVLQLTGPRGAITYCFTTNSVLRRSGNHGWARVLADVKALSFLPETRGDVEAWRWELELQPRARKISRIRPLFTFVAVPRSEASK